MLNPLHPADGKNILVMEEEKNWEVIAQRVTKVLSTGNILRQNIMILH